MSYFLSRAARVCTSHAIALSVEFASKLGKKPSSLMIRREWLPVGLKEKLVY